MKKTMRDIVVTFVIVGIISLIFWRTGWLTSAKDVLTLFLVAAAVIAVDLFAAWSWKKIKSHLSRSSE